MRILFFLLLLTLKGVTQTVEIDSLKALLLQKNINDSTRANTLCQLSWVLGDYDAKEGLLIGKEALEFSKHKGLIKNIGFAYNATAYNLNMLGEMLESISHYNYSIKIWGKLKDSLRIARALSNIGNVYSEIPIFDSAQLYYKRSIDICLRHNFKKPLSSAYLNLASLYISKNIFDESTRLLLQSLKIKEELQDDQGIANICSHISAVYKEQNNYQAALKYAKQAYEIWHKTNNINGVSYAKMQLGLVYYKLNKFDSALFFTRQSLREFEKINNQLSIATGYSQLGLIYNSINQFPKAILNFEKAKANSIKPFITETYVLSSINLVSLYLKTQRNNEAKKNLDTALCYTNSDIQKSTIKDIYKAATEYYSEICNYKKALYYNTLYNNIKDSISTEENFAVTSELQLRFETEKKESENQKLKLENNLKNVELSFARKRQIYIIILGIFFLITSIIIFYFTSKNKRAKQRLNEQQIINQTAFETEQNERTRISRELHDGVGQKLSVIKMQLSTPDPNIKIASELLDSAIDEVRNASHNLMPRDIEHGLVSAVENLSEQINYNNKTVKINLFISEAFRVLTLNKKQGLYLYRIIQEIVTNALKYSKAENIHINMDCSSSCIRIFLADDGIGFIHDENVIKGIGLKNIANRVEQLMGKISYKSELNKGTTYSIEIKHES